MKNVNTCRSGQTCMNARFHAAQQLRERVLTFLRLSCCVCLSMCVCVRESMCKWVKGDPGCLWVSSCCLRVWRTTFDTCVKTSRSCWVDILKNMDVCVCVNVWIWNVHFVLFTFTVFISKANNHTGKLGVQSGLFKFHYPAGGDQLHHPVLLIHLAAPFTHLVE